MNILNILERQRQLAIDYAPDRASYGANSTLNQLMATMRLTIEKEYQMLIDSTLAEKQAYTRAREDLEKERDAMRAEMAKRKKETEETATAMHEMFRRTISDLQMEIKKAFITSDDGKFQKLSAEIKALAVSIADSKPDNNEDVSEVPIFDSAPIIREIQNLRQSIPAPVQAKEKKVPLAFDVVKGPDGRIQSILPRFS